MAHQQSNTVYEDEVHLRTIRTALTKGNAAVLVGAGFSRNAEGGRNVGTWDDLAKALAAGMAPAGREISASVDNATQLAEQYEQLFSRSHLEQVLKTVVPDERLSPGLLHHKLLSLPWSDIFTTNYDTLLERTAERLLDSSYFTVCCREDIPLSRVIGRRRIVKLHGSFSSQRPFILTEEDYRTYPQKFAPFVNLVRQALLENILCLVGFSGDDPNFLSWIGWVRDMLDRHALPIYLFVTEQPPRGQTLLLKARGVTPVVLPMGKGGEASDYAGRYTALLDAISPSSDSSPTDWGKIAWPPGALTHSDDSKKNYEDFCRCLPIVEVHRKSYPGWLVAPFDVRRRFRHDSQRFSKRTSEPKNLQHLKDDEQAFSLVALDTYCWIQSVLLDELNDYVAEATFQVLLNTTELQFSRLSQTVRARLELVHCKSQSGLDSCWTRVLLSILAWARQTQRVSIFDSLKALASHRRVSDALVDDHVSYHSILLFLESGDRLSAQQALSRWSVRGNDVYMQVRWAALCGELGNVSSAITACENALQSRRQQLRMSPDDLQLLSEESWASLVAMYLLRSREVSRMVGASNEVNTPLLRSLDPDELDKRLDMSSKYASKTELRRAREQLNREAGVPYARNFKYNQFELGNGSGSPLFDTTPAFVQSKVEAAGSWFQLTERVGLIPRMPNARFHDDDFLQAAWWTAYFFEQHDRALGTLLRCARVGALSPRDETRPLHETGWLSRFEVGLLSAERASGLVKQLGEHIEAALVSTSGKSEIRDLDFYAEVLSRLVIRVEDLALLQDIALRLIRLYAVGALTKQPDTWRPLSKVLASCIEALDQDRQLVVLLETYKLPSLPPTGTPEHLAEAWMPISDLCQHINSKGTLTTHPSAEWYEILSSLVDLLSRTTDKRLLAKVWQRLMAADEIGLIPKELGGTIAAHLWKAWRPRQPVPVIPDYHTHASFKWARTHLTKAHEEYKRQFFENEFSPFSGGGYMQLVSKSGRSWSIPGDPVQRMTLRVLGSPDIPISELEYSALLEKFNSWLDRDGRGLAEDGKGTEELRVASLSFLTDIDLLLLKSFFRLQDGVNIFNAALVAAMRSLEEKASALGSKNLGLNLLLSIIRGDSMALTATLGDLEVCLVAEDYNVLKNAHGVAAACLSSKSFLPKAACQSLFNHLVRVSFCGTPETIAWSIGSLTDVPEEVWSQYLTKTDLYLLDNALELLFHRLAWGKDVERNGIPTDAVPLLRFKCAGLASVMCQRPAYRSPAAEKWLNAASVDPLPELRLGRFKL